MRPRETRGRRNWRVIVAVLVFGVLPLLMAACTPPAQPTGGTPGATPVSPKGFVITPGPAGRTTPVPKPAPNLELDPDKTPVAIISLTFAPDGTEIVRVANISNTEQKIGLWSLYNPRTEKRFDFPLDTTLQAGVAVQVQSGPGAKGEPPRDYLWSTESRWTDPVQEDVLLTNQAGRMMFWYVASTQH